MSEWKIYRKHADKPHNDIVAKGRLPEPPIWRDFQALKTRKLRGSNYKPSDREVEMVNTALLLRRPLLITGNPGSGKSSLAYAVAWQLNLGSVLWWPINSRSTLQDGLYTYDALGRLRDLNIEKIESERRARSGTIDAEQRQLSASEQIGRYVRLGPLGTALYGGSRPRVLLIDEIDKSDIDLPNDLLHVLEEGAFNIPELQRLTPEDAGQASEDADRTITVGVYPHDENVRSKMIPVTDGRVECNRFPFVVLTSNGERELPPAFRRRCLSLDIEDPEGDRLRDIVAAHVEEARTSGASTEVDRSVELLAEVEEVLKEFERKRENDSVLLATDQLLNAVYLITRDRAPTGEERKQILRTVLRELGRK
ncbi:MoxR family ATPase [Bradyrhizobium barranii]|uniref:AAA family ATPase n=1 Tax=Bradyrhizobium barranii TaxID=2992140 RepID=UPI0024AF5665|nr:MoxR family ATPase [Bradyrhizobium barranii]WFT94419.1 MoxR family ATPase [Bradyrhizobium barranii]